MKYALILPDGAADEPLAELGGKTTLAAARTPHMDAVATIGRVGVVRTVPKGYTPGSDVATLSVMGYDCAKYYTGRAPIEAVSKGLTLEPNDMVFRCNLVTIIDDVMEDFSAGHISQPEAEKLIADLNAAMSTDRIQFYVGVGYRHLLVIKDASDMKLKTIPPHDIPGQPIASHLPTGKGQELIRDLMDRSREVMENHEINTVRRDLGENAATRIWLWGEGTRMQVPTFEQQFGIKGAAITAVDLIRGAAISAGWKLIDVEGATGFLDTNYRGKGEAAVAALDEVDFIAVHVEAPDEAGHIGDAGAKVTAIERIDEHIVGPVMDKLSTFDEWRILIVPDHPTPCAIKTHTSTPPPFAMAGTGIAADRATAFDEVQAEASEFCIDPGFELMEYFLKAK